MKPNKERTGDLPAPAAVRGLVVPLDQVTLPVVVDTNEARCGLADRLGSLGLPVCVQRLGVGDVRVGDRIAIERKTVPDLLQSMQTGRLFKQGWALRDYERPLLLIEGDPYELLHHDDAGQVRGALLTLLLGYRVPVAQTGSLAETAVCIAHIAQQEQRRRRRWAQRDRDKGLPPAALALLESLPEIGPARARALVTQVGSIREIAAADPGTLASVPGIGPVLAARLLEALGRRAGKAG